MKPCLMANFRDTYTWRYPFLRSMRTESYNSGVRSGRTRCSRTVLYRPNSTNNCANPIAGMKVLELFLVLRRHAIRSIAFLAARGMCAGLWAGLCRDGMIRVEEV